MNRRQLTFQDIRPDFEGYSNFIQNHRHSLSLLLDGVLDVRNVGALFRLADAARLEKIYFYRMESLKLGVEFKRVARSAEQFVPFETLPSFEAVQILLQTHQLLAMEWTNDSIVYNVVTPRKPCLLAIGNEESGISEEILQIAEQCIHIPMYGIKNSLNVAVATGISVYGLLEKMITREDIF
jgi:23S rRNA (guanosine2251-2'-O)-methyltransferase